MTGPEMLRLILRDFGLVSKEDLRRGAMAGSMCPICSGARGFLRSLVAIQSRGDRGH
jgi:hypothetical protein